MTESIKCGNCGIYRMIGEYQGIYGLVEKCPNCGDDEYMLVEPMEESNSDLTKSEFEALLTKAAQPLPKPEQPPAQETEQTLESQTSDDCNESHTR